MIPSGHLQAPSAIHGTAFLNKDHDELPIGEPDLFAWDLTNVGFVCQILGTLEPIDIHIGAFITSLILVTDTPLEQLVVAIDRLVADSFISEQRANGLRTKLLRANAKFASDVGANKTVQACNQMEAFINQVNGLGRNFIPEQDAALLLDLANAVMIEEGCLQ